MQRNKIGMLVFIVLIIGSAIFGWREYNRKIEPVNNVEADFKTTAAQIIKEFEIDDSLPTKKYAGKLLAISGVTKQVDKDDHGFYTVVLGDQGSMYAIRCAMDSIFASEVNLLQKGETTTIKGMFTGFQKDETGLLGSDIILNRCVVEKAQKKQD